MVDSISLTIAIIALLIAAVAIILFFLLPGKTGPTGNSGTQGGSLLFGVGAAGRIDSTQPTTIPNPSSQFVYFTNTNGGCKIILGNNVSL